MKKYLLTGIFLLLLYSLLQHPVALDQDGRQYVDAKELEDLPLPIQAALYSEE